jgi:hypothetical protein
MRKKFSIGTIMLVLLSTLLFFGFDDCSGNNSPQQSASGISATSVKINVGADGKTTEQRNVGRRLEIDNKPGSIKHLYIISAYSGQTLIYSTVQGKVTSSGKRLTPTSVSTNNPNNSSIDGIAVTIGPSSYRTAEVLQDDGTYGSSAEYIFWWDTKGNYHQQYVTGGMIVHISDQPIAVKGIVINMEVSSAPKIE